MPDPTPDRPLPALITGDDPRAHRVRSLSVYPGAVLGREPASQLERLAHLEAQLERERAAAREDGLREGAAEVITRCAELVARAEAQARRRVDDLSQEVLDLALAVARRIIGRELHDAPERWTARVLDELDALPPQGALQLRAGVAALAALEAARPHLEAAAEGPLTLTPAPDAPDPWHVEIETPRGALTLGVDAELAVIRARWGL